MIFCLQNFISNFPIEHYSLTHVDRMQCSSVRGFYLDVKILCVKIMIISQQ